MGGHFRTFLQNFKIFHQKYDVIEQHILDTNAGKQ
jgi:hypothetical protein